MKALANLATVKQGGARWTDLVASGSGRGQAVGLRHRGLRDERTQLINCRELTQSRQRFLRSKSRHFRPFFVTGPAIRKAFRCYFRAPLCMRASPP